MLFMANSKILIWIYEQQNLQVSGGPVKSG